MKKIYLLSILFFCLFNVYSQRESILLTFQAKDSLTQNPIALDSVVVMNLTENCDTILYDSVSVLTMNATWPVGIEDPNSLNSGSFILMQNTPNPFQGSTLVRIYLKNASELNLAVYDNQGKTLSQYRDEFTKGWHLFGISTKDAQQMFLKVSDDKTTKTMKIISATPGNEGERISYQGSSGGNPNAPKSSPDAAGFIFYLGNQLQFTVYVNGYHEKILLDNPVTSQIYTFEMAAIVFNCGDPITINHVAGIVAPVDKTTTYGTITGIPGEPSKCWITSNLGSDHQATAKDDATEASAGWYWQFNRKQGYKHDGIIRTPNTTWITNINENSGWTTTNDPCTLELGNGWRIPTKTEWTNVDATGNWTNWNGPWGSGLKLHAAGVLYNFDGSLDQRGSLGCYWSSTQNSNDSGWHLYIYITDSYMSMDTKASGFPLRCIKE